MPVSLLKRSSRCLRRAPPPASTIPRSMMSEASSGGGRSRVSLTAAIMASTGTLLASLTSSGGMTRACGRAARRRCAVQRGPGGGEYGVDGYANRLPDLLGGDHDGLREPRDEVAAPDLGRLLLLQPEGAPQLYLELLGRLGADGELVLLLDVGADGVVDVVAGDADGRLVDDAAERDHGDLASPAADVHDHGPLRLVDRQPRPDGRRERLPAGESLPGAGGPRGPPRPPAAVPDHRPLRLVHGKPRPDGRRERLLDGESLPGAGGLRGLLDGPELDAGDPGGGAHHDGA